MKEIDPVGDLLPLKNRIFGLARSLVGSRQEAEDITGDVLLRLWERRDGLDVGNLEAYALAAARNLSIDRLRRHSRTERSLDDLPGLDDIPSAAPQPDTCAEQRESLEHIGRIIRSLPAKQRLVLQLRDIEELSYTEIAGQTGLSLSDVKVTLLRARKRLRETYEKNNRDGL